MASCEKSKNKSSSDNKGMKKKYWKDCPKCGFKKTFGQLITEQWYCWNCDHKADK